MEDYQNISREEKKAFWRNHITAWHESTISQKEYCKVHNIKISTFGYWINRLKKQKVSETGLVPVTFTPLNVAEKSGMALELVISDSLNLIIPADFSSQHLARVLTVLGVKL